MRTVWWRRLRSRAGFYEPVGLPAGGQTRRAHMGPFAVVPPRPALPAKVRKGPTPAAAETP